MKFISIIGLVIVTFSATALYFFYKDKLIKPQKFISPGSGEVVMPAPKPLDKFTFEHLAQRDFPISNIHLDKPLKVSSNYNIASYMFTYKVENKTVSGLVNFPDKYDASGSAKFPVIIMLRGFVERDQYKTGIGTQHAGEYFAKHGFITLAPDFLGFGESDMPENNVWWERFSRPEQVLVLINSVPSIANADVNRLGIWGHSNGGQLALSVLEISKQPYPTVLWAPVSKSFPYAILYFTDEFDDQGKALRKSLANFEQDYDVRKYSITDYFAWIKAPLQLHQGTVDDAVPVKWSDQLAKKLQKQDISVKYYRYPGADHNLLQSWSTVAKRSLEFFQKNLSK